MTIRELPGGVTLAGAVEREVHSREEMAGVLEQGSLCRAVGATNMNNRWVGALGGHGRCAGRWQAWDST